MNTDLRLERAESAEAVGVSSRKIQDILDGMLEKGINMRSIMVLRHGKVACEAWRSPLYPEVPSMLYSVSKSFTSVAFGFALQEGLFTAETGFLDIFTEYANTKYAKKLKKLKMINLVSMTSGKRMPLTNKHEKDWLKAYVKASWDFEPGTEWRYISENYYVIAAAIIRLTGMSLTEYLTPRLYEPLGIKPPFWETCPKGIETGGWGLIMTNEDLAKFTLCCQNHGVFNGKQVIPRDWIDTATIKHSALSDNQVWADNSEGYGYGFWMCAGIPNSYRCEGMYGQFGIVLKDYDACVITTASHTTQEVLDAVLEHITEAFIDDNSANDGIKIALPPYAPVPAAKRSPLEKEIGGKEYHVRKKLFLNLCTFPTSVIPMPGVIFAKERGGNIDNLSFTFFDNYCEMDWTEKKIYRNRIQIGMNGEYFPGNMKIGDLQFETRSSAAWLDDNTLLIKIRPLAVVAERSLTVIFSGKRITIKPDSVPGVNDRIKHLSESMKSILVGRYFEAWIDFLMPKLNSIVHPKHKGKQK